MGGSKELSLQKRTLLVGYKLQMGMSWGQIIEKLNELQSTLRSCYAAILRRAGVEELDAMLEHLDDSPQSGRPRITQPGSADSTLVRDDVLHWRSFKRAEAANHTRPNDQQLKPDTLR